MAAQEPKDVDPATGNLGQDVEPAGMLVNQASNNTEDEGPMTCTVQVGSGAEAVETTELENDQQNSAGKKLSSRYRGVCWNKKNKRWQAAINSSGRYLYLGSYVSEEDAARAFDRAAIRIRGRKARINFKFDDYLEELEIYSRSQNSEFSSDITLEMHGKPAVLGPTITSHVHSSFSSRDHRMINPAGNSNHPRFDSLESVVHHSGHAERHQHYPVMNGIPLQRDSLGMSRSRSPSTCATKSDALVGRVVQRSLRPTPPMNTSPWINAKYEQTESASPMPSARHHHEQIPNMHQQNVPQYVDLFGRQQSSRPAGPEALQHDPSSSHQDQHTPWVQNGFAIPQGSSDATIEDPMSTIPKDCHIVKIIPNASGVFAVLYARPGHLSTGVVIWDGQSVHNMGMFTTRADAQQACNAACSIVVKLIKHLSGSLPPKNPSVSDKEHEGTPGPQSAAKAVVEPVAVHPGAQKDPSSVVVQCAPERQAPRTSPFVPENSGSLFKLISIPSQELNKYFNNGEVSVPSSSFGGWTKTDNPSGGATQKPTKESGQGNTNRAVAELVSENKGNLGSLLHYDSWSSSILGLISLSVAKGPDGAEKTDKPSGLTTEYKLDNKEASIDPVPKSSGAEGISMSASREGRNDVSSSAWKPSGAIQEGRDVRLSALGSERVRAEKDGRGGQSPPAGDAFVKEDWRMLQSGSSFPHFSPTRGGIMESQPTSRCENGSYNDVVEMIVPRDRTNRRKPGSHAPSRAPGDMLVDNREHNAAENYASIKRRGAEFPEEDVRYQPQSKKVRVLEKDRT